MHRLIAFLVLVVIAQVSTASDLPSSLVCTSNAKAWRDYDDHDQKWAAETETGRSGEFSVSTSKHPDPAFPLRDKVFSQLASPKVIVRSITPASQGVAEAAVEFEATVLLRNETGIYVSWHNDLNKVWTALIDVKNKKAIVTHVFRGVTSVGGEIETLDCR